MGEGGFATVFSAQDTIEDRKGRAQDPRQPLRDQFTSRLEDMQREVRIMARLDHPGVHASEGRQNHRRPFRDGLPPR